MSIKQVKTDLHKAVIIASGAPISERDELLDTIERLERAIKKMTKRPKEDRVRAITNIIGQLSGMTQAEMRNHIVTTFDRKFFENEYDLKFKEELAGELYRFCKVNLNWDYLFLKKQAFLL